MTGLAFSGWKLAFQLSPIILTNGLATNMPGGMLPIIALTESLNFTEGLLSGAQNISLDDFFANFEPLPGATLIDQDFGEYPFANQAVAANAVIANPLEVSLRMICPVRNPAGYPVKLATMIALKTALAQHNGSGGTYTIATPSQFYTNCLMKNMRDISTGESKQTQFIWQMDFRQPLLTLQSAQQAQNSLLSKLTGGTNAPPDSSGAIPWSGLGNAVGQPPTLAASSVIPSSSGAAGVGVAGLQSALGALGQ